MGTIHAYVFGVGDVTGKGSRTSRKTTKPTKTEITIASPGWRSNLIWHTGVLYDYEVGLGRPGCGSGEHCHYTTRLVRKVVRRACF
jgi:hypothetical protein